VALLPVALLPVALLPVALLPMALLPVAVLVVQLALLTVAVTLLSVTKHRSWWYNFATILLVSFPWWKVWSRICVKRISSCVMQSSGWRRAHLRVLICTTEVPHSYNS
jgi:hypothetical protein